MKISKAAVYKERHSLHRYTALYINFSFSSAVFPNQAEPDALSGGQLGKKEPDARYDSADRRPYHAGQLSKGCFSSFMVPSSPL